MAPQISFLPPPPCPVGCILKRKQFGGHCIREISDSCLTTWDSITQGALSPGPSLVTKPIPDRTVPSAKWENREIGEPPCREQFQVPPLPPLQLWPQAKYIHFRITQTLIGISAGYSPVVRNSYQVRSFSFLLLKEKSGPLQHRAA